LRAVRTEIDMSYLFGAEGNILLNVTTLNKNFFQKTIFVN